MCLERGADLHTVQLMPLQLTVSCFSKIQIGFTILVPAHLGSPGQRAIKRMLLSLLFTAVEPSKSVCVSSQVRVLYGGNDVFDYEVRRAFWHDICLAIISVVTIVVLMLILTSCSVWLTVWGVITIVLSFPLAYFFYRVVFNDVALGMLNGAAAFVVIGIGNTHTS